MKKERISRFTIEGLYAERKEARHELQLVQRCRVVTYCLTYTFGALFMLFWLCFDLPRGNCVTCFVLGIFVTLLVFLEVAEASYAEAIGVLSEGIKERVQEDGEKSGIC